MVNLLAIETSGAVCSVGLCVDGNRFVRSEHVEKKHNERLLPMLEGLREDIIEQRAKLKPKLIDRRERLAKLGPVPKEGAPKESDDIAAQRKSLESEVAALDGKLKQADVLFVRAGQVIGQHHLSQRLAIHVATYGLAQQGQDSRHDVQDGCLSHAGA